MTASNTFCSWLELVFNPRSNMERNISKLLRAVHPYLSFITYRFHVEKCREAGKLPLLPPQAPYLIYYYIGMRVEDFYNQKFWKEPYVQFHIYGQYFHPHTLLERVRDVNFYRRPRTLFKGFRVPDWATAD